MRQRSGDLVIPPGQMQQLFFKRFRALAVDGVGAKGSDSGVDLRARGDALLEMQMSPSFSKGPSLDSIQTTESLRQVRDRQRLDLVLRKAMQSLFRFRSR